MLIALQFEIDNFIDYTNGEALLFQPVFLIQLRLKTNFFQIFKFDLKVALITYGRWAGRGKNSWNCPVPSIAYP